MTSRVTVYATPEEMERLFDDTQGGFSIRYYEQTERMGDQAKFDVTVRHGDNIGYKDGETYDYKSFIDTFDDLELRALNSKNNSFSETDMEMAQRGLEGGLSVKTVKQILKIYGSSKCTDEKYIKALMKSEDIQSLVNQIKTEEKNLSR